ncbi:MAG: hypothetical protein ACP5T2_01650 [Thermoprotei archaeon]
MKKSTPSDALGDGNKLHERFLEEADLHVSAYYPRGVRNWPNEKFRRCKAVSRSVFGD